MCLRRTVYYCSGKLVKLFVITVSLIITQFSVVYSLSYYLAGSRILNVEVPKEQTYPLKLKGISICFSMLKAALCGSYVNFGVFRLYGDEALDNALNIFVKLLLSIPQSDLLVSVCPRTHVGCLYISLFGCCCTGLP